MEPLNFVCTFRLPLTKYLSHVRLITQRCTTNIAIGQCFRSQAILSTVFSPATCNLDLQHVQFAPIDRHSGNLEKLSGEKVLLTLGCN